MNQPLTNLNRTIDHAALHSEFSEKEIVQLCREAREHSFYSVAVNPIWTKRAKSELKDSEVKILTVSGFPLGASRTDVKVIEAVKGVSDGADEIDMVANIGWLASGQFDQAEEEIRIIRENLPYNVLLKVIIEAGKLSEKQQREATRCVVKAGAQFVKTCTGFFGGATVDQVSILADSAAGEIEVKASGGIRTLEQCRQLLAAGASRLGSSSSVAIMSELHTEHSDKR
ncbi:MAG: deoxyribose-phosphate aldolase [bacterium]|nr:deoxyribose-phosphate aldolase [bacterium]